MTRQGCLVCKPTSFEIRSKSRDQHCKIDERSGKLLETTGRPGWDSALVSDMQQGFNDTGSHDDDDGDPANL